MIILEILLSAVCGLALWSFAEYALHNWNGHWMRGRTMFSRLHLKHHADTRFYAPTAYKVAAAIPLLGIVGPLTCWLVGVPAGIAFTASFGAMYFGYEILHRRTHTHAPRGAYSRWARKHHMHHHFHNPKSNHGVSSPIWDIVFGTYEVPTVIRVPERHAPLWLIDPATGNVRREHAGDYTLAKKRKREAETVDTRADMDAALACVAPGA